MVGAGVAVVGLASLLGTVSRGHAAGSPQAAAGVVAGVQGDALPTDVTLTTSLQSVTLHLTPETRFVLNGDQGEAAELGAHASGLSGRFASLWYDPATLNVTSVSVEEPGSFYGKVVSVSSANAPATVTLDAGFGALTTLNVTTDTNVVEDFTPVTNLAQSRGTVPFVLYDPETLNVVTLSITPEVRRLHGRVVSINPEKSTLLVADGSRTVTLVVDTFGFGDDLSGLVFVDYLPARLTELQRGMEIEADYVQQEAAVATTVQAVSAPSATVTGTVGDLSPDTGTIVPVEAAAPLAAHIAKRRVPPRLIKVNNGTRITLNGRRVRLKDIPRGARFTARVATRRGLVIARTVVAKARRR